MWVQCSNPQHSICPKGQTEQIFQAVQLRCADLEVNRSLKTLPTFKANLLVENPTAVVYPSQLPSVKDPHDQPCQWVLYPAIRSGAAKIWLYNGLCIGTEPGLQWNLPCVASHVVCVPACGCRVWKSGVRRSLRLAGSLSVLTALCRVAWTVSTLTRHTWVPVAPR